jgi:quercetin dioxygenase-like cupin family protein
MKEAAPAPYKVRNIYVVARGSDVLVREYTLGPGEAIPWHRHSEVHDYYYALEGKVLIETREPSAHHELAAGESAHVSPWTIHQVSNGGTQLCRFLLVQGVGKYDFVPAV